MKTKVNKKTTQNSKKLPLISLLVPMYNTEKYIDRCIKSILKQTYKNIEVVLVDDDSTDSTLKLAQNWANKDKRIKLFIKQNEKNVSITRNFLLERISGKYFVFIDSDDYVEKTFVETLYSNLIKNKSDCSMCNFKMQKVAMPIINAFKNSNCITAKEMLCGMALTKDLHFMLWNKLFKTNLLKDITFDPATKYGEDFCFCYKYFKNCKKVSYTNEALYHYMLRKGSEIHGKFNKEKQMSFVYALKNIIENESDPDIAYCLAGWLAFVGLGYIFLMNSAKVKDDELKKELLEIGQKYSNNILVNNKTRPAYKFAFKFLKRRYVGKES